MFTPSHLATLYLLPLLASCATLQSNAELPRRPFLDAQGQLQEITFWRKTNANEPPKQGEIVGEAWIRTAHQDNTHELGSIIHSGRLPDGRPVSSIFINGDTQQTTSQSTDLAQARHAIFYSFGGGLLEEIHYQADGALCAQWRQGKVIRVQSATNYYAPNNNQQFFTSLLKSTITHQQGKIINAQTNTSHLNPSAPYAQSLQHMIHQQMATMNAQDISKQVRILSFEICR